MQQNKTHIQIIITKLNQLKQIQTNDQQSSVRKSIIKDIYTTLNETIFSIKQNEIKEIQTLKIKKNINNELLIKQNAIFICLKGIEKYLNDTNKLLFTIEKENDENDENNQNTRNNQLIQIHIDNKEMINDFFQLYFYFIKNNEKYQQEQQIINSFNQFIHNIQNNQRNERNEINQIEIIFFDIHSMLWKIKIYFLLKLQRKLTLKDLYQFHSTILQLLSQSYKYQQEMKEVFEINKQRFIEIKQQNETYQIHLQQIQNTANEKIKQLVDMYNSLINEAEEQAKELQESIESEKDLIIEQLEKQIENMKIIEAQRIKESEEKEEQMKRNEVALIKELEITRMLNCEDYVNDYFKKNNITYMTYSIQLVKRTEFIQIRREEFIKMNEGYEERNDGSIKFIVPRVEITELRMKGNEMKVQLVEYQLNKDDVEDDETENVFEMNQFNFGSIGSIFVKDPMNVIVEIIDEIN